MKNIERLLKIGDYNKLEELLKKSLFEGNATMYSLLCDLIRIEPEDQLLYELGKADIFSKEYKNKKIEERKDNSEIKNYYSKYGIPEKCPEDFWQALNYAKKVPSHDRLYQEKVRRRYGFYYEPFFPAYNAKTKSGRKEIIKHLIKRFPNNKKDIEKLTPKQLNFAYYVIRGVWG